MKRLLIALAALTLVLCLTSCGEENAPPEEIDPDSHGDSTEAEVVAQKGEEFRSRILAGDYAAEDLWDHEAPDAWAAEWAEYVYGDYGISQVEAMELYGCIYSEFSDSLTIGGHVYQVQFAAEKPVEGAALLEDGRYELRILLALAVPEEGSPAVLSQIFGPGEFDEDYAVPTLYEAVATDSRYQDQLEPYPDPVVPEGIEVYRIKDIAGEHHPVNAAPQALLDGTIAFLCADETEDGYEAGVLFFRDGDVISYIETGAQMEVEPYVNGREIYSARGSLEARGDSVALLLGSEAEGRREILISPQGVLGDWELPAGVRVSLTSPDGQANVYSQDGSLMLRDSQGERLLVEGDMQSPPDVYAVSPYQWLDNDRLVYQVAGWESAIGWGVYNIRTGEDQRIDDTGMWLLAVDGETVYTYYSLESREATGLYAFDMSGEAPQPQMILDDLSGEEGSLWIQNFSARNGQVVSSQAGASASDLSAFLLLDAETGEELSRLEYRLPFCTLSGLTLYGNRQAVGYCRGHSMMPDILVTVQFP